MSLMDALNKTRLILSSLFGVFAKRPKVGFGPLFKNEPLENEMNLSVMMINTLGMTLKYRGKYRM